MLGWAFALVTGRMPGGLRDLGVASLRYHGQVLGYLALADVPVSRLVPGLVVPSAPSRDARVNRPSRAAATRVTTARPSSPIDGAVGVAWVAAAWLLARSVVPDDLSLPRVDVDAVFGKALVDRAERYERFLYVDWALAQVALLATLAVYAKRGVRYVRESAAGPIGTGMLLGMVGLAIVWLAQLPFSVAALWWDRRHGVSEVGYLEHVFGGWLALGGTFVAVCVALLVVMALARWLGSWWWIPGAGVFALIAAVFVFVGPYLTPGLEPSHDARLNRTYARFERAQGVEGHPPARRGGQRRHEPGERLRLRHGPVLADRALGHAAGRPLHRRRGGRRPRPRARAPLERPHPEGDRLVRALRAARRARPDARDAAARRHGRARRRSPRAPRRRRLPARRRPGAEPRQPAAWRARRTGRRSPTTHDPAAARGLFREFAATSLGDPSPPTWAYLMLQTHPTLAQRVAMANAWAARERSG